MQRWLALAATATALLASTARLAAAQGLTTGAISGTVTENGSRPLENAQVEIRNLETGFRAGAITRTNGRFFVQGLTVGGPYSVTVRLLGYAPVTRNDLTVSLGGNTVVDVQLRQAAAQLAAVAVTADPSGREFTTARQGVGTVVSDSLLRRIGTLQRDYTDLVKLTPQVIKPQDG
ncbi:MAG: carboxypeptidase-like regulatory domain-containing protein, partial [Gemmatimonas sp.]